MLECLTWKEKIDSNWKRNVLNVVKAAKTENTNKNGLLVLSRKYLIMNWFVLTGLNFFSQLVRGHTLLHFIFQKYTIEATKINNVLDYVFLTYIWKAKKLGQLNANNFKNMYSSKSNYYGMWPLLRYNMFHRLCLLVSLSVSSQ